jgi:hypothetical protein
MKKKQEAKDKAEAEMKLFANSKVLCRTQDGTQIVYNNVIEVAAAIGMSVPAVKVHIKDGKPFNWNDTWYQLSLTI